MGRGMGQSEGRGFWLEVPIPQYEGRRCAEQTGPQEPPKPPGENTYSKRW